MKLIYLSELRLPTKNAHGFHIMNMCDAFAGEGIDVLLLAPWRKNLLKEDPFDFYGVRRNFAIKKLPAIDLYPLRFIPERISAFIHLFSFLISARIYLWLNKYDGLYTREKYVALFFKDFIYEVHMPEQMYIRGFKPKKIVVLNNYIKDKIKESGTRDDDILVAPDAVNLKMFPKISKEDARERLGFPHDKLIALYWGNFKKWKGVDILAEAVPFLKNVLTVIIGGTKDSDVARIKEKVSRYGNVIVEGFRPQKELPWYLAVADVLVLPNSAKDENSRLYTSPLKLFEYMASNRPIVASDLPSFREILNENNAVFFFPDDPRSLAQAVRDILFDDSKATDIANQARNDVEKYTWDKRARMIIDFINHP